MTMHSAKRTPHAHFFLSPKNSRTKVDSLRARATEEYRAVWTREREREKATAADGRSDISGRLSNHRRARHAFAPEIILVATQRGSFDANDFIFPGLSLSLSLSCPAESCSKFPFSFPRVRARPRKILRMFRVRRVRRVFAESGDDFVESGYNEVRRE